MLRWRKWPTDECPRCGQQETTEHIWIYKGKDSLLPWTTALTRLEKWMEAVQTDPDIIAAIMNQLHSWRHDIEDSSSYSWEIQNAIDQQTDICWQYAIEGWLSIEWEILQQSYLDNIQTNCTGKRWMSELIKQLWAIAWDLWEHHNSILHDQMNTVTDTRQNMVDRAITNMFYTASALLSHTIDDFLVAVPLQTL